MNKLFLLLGLTGFVAMTGCSSNETNTPDGGATTGGEGGSAPDGGQPDGGHPSETKHTATTRPLFGGSSAQNLLLDPLVTTDNSLEHFIGIATRGTGVTGYRPLREILSQSPMGVALPVVAMPTAGSIDPEASKLQMLAPLPGTDAIDASIWVSAGDLAGKSVSFSDASKDLVVAMLPNDQPTKSYPLVPTGKPVKLGDRSWQKLALKSVTAFPEGGWISIANSSVKWTYLVQAPEVIEGAPTDARADSTPRDARDREAISAYPKIAQRPKPRRH